MSEHKHLKHPVKVYSSRAISALLSGVLVLGGASAALADPAPAPAPASGAAAAAVQSQASAGVFGDVKAGFWAEKHIYKLAAQGIVIGNNGSFRPSDSVTQQEAVLMALRFMNLQDQANASATVALPSGFGVSNYFKPYVVLAFQKGLLDKAEEMAADNLKTSWGERKASREWIAELLIRALGKASDAAAVSGEPTGFADDAKVSANKRGYINAAVDLGLANGLEGNRFDPQGYVTRAQLATFLSRAQNVTSAVYSNANMKEGIVTSLSSNQLKLYTADGRTAAYSLNAGTAYFTKTAEARVSYADLKPYTKVLVIGSGGNAAYVEVVDPAQQVETVEGTFAMLSASSGKLFLKTAEGFPEYAYDANTQFSDVNGAKLEPSGITPDSKVRLVRERFTGLNRLLTVQVTSGIVNKSAEGTLAAVDTAAKKLTFRTASGSEETFAWEDGATFLFQKQLVAPAELKPGLAVKYTIKNNVIQSVEVTQGIERTVQGMLNELTPSSVVYKKADGTREVKLLAAKPAVIIPGMSGPSAADLITDAADGDMVELTLSSSDQVTRISVLSRKLQQYTAATVIGYNNATKLLTVRDNSGSPRLFQLSESTKANNLGAQVTLANIGYALTEGRKVNVSAIGERALSVEIAAGYEGTLSAVNPATKMIVIKTAGGESLMLPYPAVVEWYGRAGAQITDVPVGTALQVILSGDQQTIQSLKVKSSLQQQVVSVNAAAGRITVKGDAGTAELYVTGLPLTDEAGSPVTLSAVKAGDFLNIRFAGSSPLSLRTVVLSAGQVTSVDAAGGNLTLRKFDGTSVSIAAGTQVKITRSGAVSTALSGLTAADRVEIRKDAEGGTLITVLAASAKTFSRYDAATRTVTVKRENAAENNQFRLAAGAYVHQGDTTISVQSLKENDKITVYFNNDEIVEIVKQ